MSLNTTATKPTPKVYISGPMTGLPDLNFPAFHAAANQLRGLGLDPVNPADINPDSGMTWAACMRADIKALCDCDALALLPGWEASRGAHLELHLAHRPETLQAITPKSPDPLLEKARALVMADGKASISYIQRKLKTGYNTAAQLLESLEAEGVVSAMDSIGCRQVLKKGCAA